MSRGAPILASRTVGPMWGETFDQCDEIEVRLDEVGVEAGDGIVHIQTRPSTSRARAA